MKRLLFLFHTLVLMLLLTACGAGQKNVAQPPQTAQAESIAVPTAEEMPIGSILLSSANELTERSEFIYITPTQIITGKVAQGQAITAHPYNYMESLEQLWVTDIPKEAFEEMCEQLRALRYALLPGEIERPEGREELHGALYTCLRIQESHTKGYFVEGYAAELYHEGFAEICRTVRRNVESLVKKYTAVAAHQKPIASIMLSSRNGYARQSSFTYLTRDHVVQGGMNDYVAIKGDPIANPGAMHMKIADIPSGVFDEICTSLWQMRFDRLPAQITQPEDKAVADDSDYELIVRFEDGTSFTSGGYAACYYLQQFSTIWSYASRQGSLLMAEYEVPEKEIKEISAVIGYSYNEAKAQSGGYGYRLYAFEALYTFSGQTRNTPFDLKSPFLTENLEPKTVSLKVDRSFFRRLCTKLREMDLAALPAVIETDQSDTVTDGNMQYLIIRYADGTEITSQGYRASENNEQFAAIWRLMEQAYE